MGQVCVFIHSCVRACVRRFCALGTKARGCEMAQSGTPGVGCEEEREGCLLLLLLFPSPPFSFFFCGFQAPPPAPLPLASHTTSGSLRADKETQKRSSRGRWWSSLAEGPGPQARTGAAAGKPLDPSAAHPFTTQCHDLHSAHQTKKHRRTFFLAPCRVFSFLGKVFFFVFFSLFRSFFSCARTCVYFLISYGSYSTRFLQ